ncbi:MAG: hypothetical protein ABR574_04605 [Cryomorphaceae bacterium]|nr:hypothetical protein [Flavobacteriales bacterium]
MAEEILDFKSKKTGKQKVESALYIAAIALFIYWFIGNLMHWPFAVLSLLLGLFILAVVSLLKFVRNRKAGFYQLFYFFGKLALLIAIFLNFSHYPYAEIAMWFAFGSFSIGILLLTFQKRTD